MTSTENNGPALRPGAAAVMVALLSAGIGVALYLTRIKLQLEFDPTYESSCNLGGKLNCDLVQTSATSTIFGHPLALWGAITYAVALVLTLLATRKNGGRAFLGGLAVGGLVVCAHSLYLAYVSSFVIGAYCLFCLSMYAVNVLTTALAVIEFKRGGGLGGVVQSFTSPRHGAIVAGLFVVFGVLGAKAYADVRARMSEQRIVLAKAEMAAALAPAPAAPADAAPAESNTAKTTPPAAAAAKTATKGRAVETADAGIQTHPTAGFRYSDVITLKGRAYYEVPLGEHDWPLGPADAPVSITMFGDFECGYCRSLYRNMKPIKRKYEGKIRWLFKHWPLNNDCNKVMKGVQHPQACLAAKASNCAGAQGKFWPMHDVIYDQTLRLNALNLREWAIKAGADGPKYDACMASPDDHPKLADDIRAGRFARIAGTPRTYINGHLVPGVVATEILEYYVQAAISAAKNGGTTDKSAPTRAATDARDGMVRARTAKSEFWIDAYEGSLDDQGRARSQPNVAPAEVSWFEAHAACKTAQKRLCSEEEWVSACTGAPAIDANGNGDFTDDAVQGSLYPYGPFPEGGRCNDNQKGDGHAAPTGSYARCVSPTGIFDMSANLAEWTGATQETGLLSGTDFRWGAKATCLNRQKRFGLGYRNTTTGFRCCADAAVPAPKDGTIVKHAGHADPGNAIPEFTANHRDGSVVSAKTLAKGVWIVSFFASWCGPCRRELPDLDTFYGEHKKRGLRILAVGVDVDDKAMRSFAADLKLSYDVAFDPTAVAMGAFGVRGMPTAFLAVDGQIRERLVGINADKTKEFKAAALAALK